MLFRNAGGTGVGRSTSGAPSRCRATSTTTTWATASGSTEVTFGEPIQEAPAPSGSATGPGSSCRRGQGRQSRPGVDGPSGTERHPERFAQGALVPPATTSTWPSARATCSSRRFSWPTPTRPRQRRDDVLAQHRSCGPVPARLTSCGRSRPVRWAGRASPRGREADRRRADRRDSTRPGTAASVPSRLPRGLPIVRQDGHGSRLPGRPRRHRALRAFGPVHAAVRGRSRCWRKPASAGSRPPRRPPDPRALREPGAEAARVGPEEASARGLVAAAGNAFGRRRTRCDGPDGIDRHVRGARSVRAGWSAPPRRAPGATDRKRRIGGAAAGVRADGFAAPLPRAVPRGPTASCAGTRPRPGGTSTPCWSRRGASRCRPRRPDGVQRHPGPGGAEPTTPVPQAPGRVRGRRRGRRWPWSPSSTTAGIRRLGAVIYGGTISCCSP